MKIICNKFIFINFNKFKKVNSIEGFYEYPTTTLYHEINTRKGTIN